MFMLIYFHLQALMLMYQLLSGRNAISDRFYRALYAVLLTEGATGAAGETDRTGPHAVVCWRGAGLWWWW